MKHFMKIVLSILIMNTVKGDLELKMVINLFRHGARLPYVPSQLGGKEDENPLIDDSDLTPIGMRQQYLLGRAIRQKYGDFLAPQYNYANVEAYSSNRRRTIVSALSQIQGIFDLGTGFDIDNDNKDYYNPPIENFNIPFPENEKHNALPKRPTFIPVQNPDTHRNTVFLAGSECPVLKDKISKVRKSTFAPEEKTF